MKPTQDNLHNKHTTAHQNYSDNQPKDIKAVLTRSTTSCAWRTTTETTRTEQTPKASCYFRIGNRNSIYKATVLCVIVVAPNVPVGRLSSHTRRISATSNTKLVSDSKNKDEVQVEHCGIQICCASRLRTSRFAQQSRRGTGIYNTTIPTPTC